jgi:hypothetical protein
LRRGIVIPSSGVFTDNFTIAAFDGINDLPVDSRPFLPIMSSLNGRTKEYFHLSFFPFYLIILPQKI